MLKAPLIEVIHNNSCSPHIYSNNILTCIAVEVPLNIADKCLLCPKKNIFEKLYNWTIVPVLSMSSIDTPAFFAAKLEAIQQLFSNFFLAISEEHDDDDDDDDDDNV